MPAAMRRRRGRPRSAPTRSARSTGSRSSGSPDVIVAVGGAPSVRAEGDADLIERLEVVVENGQLRIGIREGSGRWFSFRHHRGVTLHVTVPSLAGASDRGLGRHQDRPGRRDRASTARSPAPATWRSERSRSARRTSRSRARAAFAAPAAPSARWSRWPARATSTSSGSKRPMPPSASPGSGDIGIRATRTATVDLRGSGDITVAGPARCTISKSGSGDVRCEG